MSEQVIDYRPRGGMCSVCTKRQKDCSELDFASFPVSKKDKDGVVAVICQEFEKEIKLVL